MLRLERENGHVRDEEVAFEAQTHTYTIRDSKSLTKPVSVTTLTSKGVWPAFDADATIDRILSSEKYKSGESPYAGMKRSQIRAQWDAAGLEARVEGTKLHDRIEKWYNREDGTKDTKEGKKRELSDDTSSTSSSSSAGMRKSARLAVHLELEVEKESKAVEDLREKGEEGDVGMSDISWRQFRGWADKNGHLRPYRTEWRIFSRRCNVAGSVDMVFYNERTGALDIYDWKRSKEIKCDGWGRYATHPLLKEDEIPDANFYKYSLQLAAYKYILETEYELPYPIGELWLVRMDGDESRMEGEAIRAADMSGPIKKLMEDRWN
jgi:hypothetical protein